MSLLTSTQTQGPEHEPGLITYDYETYGDVATQGREGSYHYEAVRQRFHPDVPIISCGSFDEVFGMLDQGDAAFAVVAVDNSKQGLVTNQDGLANRQRIEQSPHPIITPSILLEVQLCLIGLPGAEPENLRRVSSHPAALNQTREWLGLHLPGVEIVPHEDTAGAVADLQNTDEAAIASREAALHYGGHVLHVIQREPELTEFDVLQSAAQLDVSINS